MWGAIKSDLFDFVNTVHTDTTKTLNKVLGDDEEEEDVTLQDKIVADLRRSYETYANPIKETNTRDYEKFQKKFNLSSYANEIANVLDEESEVSRFYAELVPVKITPEIFWSRFFFRVKMVYRGGSAGLDDEDDDEELVWEEEDQLQPETDQLQVGKNTKNEPSEREKMLEQENLQLKEKIEHLNSRIEELEKQLSSKHQVEVKSTKKSNMKVTKEITKTPDKSVKEEPFFAPDNISQLSESEGSTVMVNASDINPVPEFEKPVISAVKGKKKTPGKGSIKSPAVTVIEQSNDENNEKSSPEILRKKGIDPAVYLASLDDEDDEEVGWN